MVDHFIVGTLRDAVALLALLAVIRKTQYSTDEERILIAETLRDVADEIAHRHLLIQ
jgi:hypothetical protein